MLPNYVDKYRKRILGLNITIIENWNFENFDHFPVWFMACCALVAARKHTKSRVNRFMMRELYNVWVRPKQNE